MPKCLHSCICVCFVLIFNIVTKHRTHKVKFCALPTELPVLHLDQYLYFVNLSKEIFPTK